MTVFGVHFPAPFHPVELRTQALEFLQKLLEQKGKTQLVMAAGDFNIPGEEDKKNNVLDKYVRPYWLLAQDVCDGCVGTTHYAQKNSWSFLDMILFSKNMETSAWKMDPASVTVVRTAVEQRTVKGHPKSFALPEATGVSDHWPLALTLRLNSAIKP
jgi:endonuclease/exonuclease/phosphatase family metal-dependent hydrolase